jgi:hypothetical protein
MRRFISKFITFVCIAAVIVICIPAGIYFVRSKVSFKIPPDKHIIVTGDSHTELAIDDNIYLKSVNISQGGSAYLYSYCKLQKFLNENTHIDTVLLSFHYGPLMDLIDNRWILGSGPMMYKIPFYLTLLNKEEIAIFTNHDKFTFIKAVFNLPFRFFVKSFIKVFIKRGNISYDDLNIGGYIKSDRNKLQKNIELYEKRTEEEEVNISLCQLEYLLKIVDLCKCENVELILINTPVYKPEIYESIDKLNDFYDTYLSEVKYLDYSAFPLPDSCYGDIGHLNYKGAQIFSKYLQENLNVDIRSK